MHLISPYFFFNGPPTTEIYTLSLHDALPIYLAEKIGTLPGDGERTDAAAADATDGSPRRVFAQVVRAGHLGEDRKSTRLNSSHSSISYAVFCLKKKKLI